MCGIAGYLGGKPDKKILKKMTDRIKHRGPDAEGFYVDEKVALGHRRLSIIDLNTGDQPIYNEDKSIVIVFNGEIYNFKELKKELKNHKFKTSTDTEVIVHGYEEWGFDITKKLRGMFSFALWDTKKEILFLARDGWGIKPLYYYENNNTFMFASEIKAFLDHPDFKKEFNESILTAYMCFNSVPTKESFFKGVYKLLPGEQLIIKDGKKKLETFFELSFDVKEDTLEGYAEKINNAMIDSVNHHLISDVEVGSFLSSGVDSSYLVSISKVKETFTVGYDNPKYDEISYAKDLADRLGINNTSRKISRKEYLDKFSEILYYMDEPLADPAAIALYFVSEVASKKVKVVTSGEGADELFGGYNSYDEELSQSWYMKIPFPIRRLGYYIAKALPDKWGLNFVYRRGQRLPEYYIGIGRVFRNEEALKYVNNKNQVDIKEITKPYFEKYKSESTFIQRQVIDYYFWLVNDFLHAVDRNTMMFGLEARTPFLDKEVYDVARTLTNSAKLTKETTKPALRLAAKKVIPNESYNKKKLGFPVPLREWIKEDDLYNKIKEAFSSDVAAKYFKQNKLLKLLENNRKGKSDNYKKIWTIYTFLVWYNEFFIKEG